MGLVAITREVSPALADCELTHLDRTPIDLERARVQHLEYERVLERSGCALRRLPAEPSLPDSGFVEDVAVVFDEVAIAARPGAPSRRGEVGSVVEALRPFREVRRMSAPATLDGGDVLVLGRSVYVGLTGRTGDEGVAQLRELLAPHGYTVSGVPVRGCLHLKSAVTRVSRDSVLVNPEWVDPAVFEGWRRIEINPGEPYAANGLAIEDAVVYPVSFPRTADLLRDRGIRLELVDLSELAKAEGAVTCCSLVFEIAEASSGPSGTYAPTS